MQVREKTKAENFVPFTVEITFENADEARLMWHVFNRGHLWEAISKDKESHYGGGYIEPASEFKSELTAIIGQHVKV